MIKAKIVMNITHNNFENSLFAGDEVFIMGKAYNEHILPEEWGYIAVYHDTIGNWHSIVADPKLLKIKKSYKDMEKLLPFFKRNQIIEMK